MLDESAHLPVWVRRADGSQVPFEADRICQSLYAAAESLGSANPFLIRELTDAVLHFLGRQPWDTIPDTIMVAEEVAKIVREMGQPHLARRYAEMQAQPTASESATIQLPREASPQRYYEACQGAYLLDTVFSRDVAAAVREGLLTPRGERMPATLSRLVLQTPRLAELPWWTALDDWRASGGDRWIVESPEWLCTPQMHPALTPHLCERLLALPTLGPREVELHLNIAAPPRWSVSAVAGPLFGGDEDDSSRERSNFLDGLIERWKSLDTPRTPTIAWHLHARSFDEESQRQQLQTLIRQALSGRLVRFVFDRPHLPVPLAEGLDRKAPGVILEIGLDLVAFARRPEIAGDGIVLLQKLPTLVRIAVSAVAQKREFLRGLPDASPLHQRFLIERSTGVLVPLGLDEVTRSITGERPTRSPLSLDFALKLLGAVRDSLAHAGRAVGLDLRLELPSVVSLGELDAASHLHARGGGIVLLDVSEKVGVDEILERLHGIWRGTSIPRVQFQRTGAALQQGELPI